MLKRLILAVALISLSFGGVSAKDAGPPALLKTVATFEKAMGADDFGTVIDMVPQKVFAQMAKELKVTPEKLASLVADQMKTVLDDVTIIAFGMDTTDAEIAETKNGIAYTFLPTRTVVEVKETKVETNSHTLALRDDETWSLVRIDDAAQLRVLRTVYPGFTEVDFPRGTTKLLN